MQKKRKSILRVAIFSLILATLPPSVSAHAEEVNRAFDLRLFPVGLLLGEYMGDVNFAPLSWLSLGVIGYDANVDVSGSAAKGKGYGGRVTLHLAGHKFETGWILNAYWYRVGTFDLSEQTLSGSTATATLHNIEEMGAVIGKTWTYASGFSMTFALGVRKLNGPDSLTLTAPDNSNITHTNVFSGLGPRIEFTCGWAL